MSKASHAKCSTHLLVQRQAVCSAGGATTQVLFMLCKDHIGCFQGRPGMDPAAKEVDKCGLPVCLRGRNCVNTEHRLGKFFFFFFFKASLKDKQVELRLVVTCLRSQHY